MENLKTHIIKLFALAIGMIYLLMPIHKEVKSVLHSLSHSIENLNFSIHHDHAHTHQHENLKKEFSEATVLHHKHKIINILDYLTEASDHHKESKNSKILDVEFDKHFHSSNYSAIKFPSNGNPSANDIYRENIKDGFYFKIKIPPKHI
tara:strand:- start:45746 stop:46192 length:447 start_codon:yes stop_codon:yes gene_type:complete